MVSKEMKYQELARAPVNEKKNIVISKYENKGFTLAQQIIVEEGKHKINVFMKNAIQLDNKEALYNLRDALNIAIERIEKN